MINIPLEGNKHGILLKVRIYKLTGTNSLVWIHKHRNLEFPRGKKKLEFGTSKSQVQIPCK